LGGSNGFPTQGARTVTDSKRKTNRKVQDQTGGKMVGTRKRAEGGISKKDLNCENSAEKERKYRGVSGDIETDKRMRTRERGKKERRVRQKGKHLVLITRRRRRVALNWFEKMNPDERGFPEGAIQLTKKKAEGAATTTAVACQNRPKETDRKPALFPFRKTLPPPDGIQE